MNFRRESWEEPTVQLTPLIDIVFLLLFFFLTLSVFYTMERDIRINVPKAESEPSEGASRNLVVVNVDQEGRIFLGRKERTRQELQAVLERWAEKVPEGSVAVRGDRKVPYERIVDVLDTCRAAGIENLSLAVVHGEQ